MDLAPWNADPIQTVAHVKDRRLSNLSFAAPETVWCWCVVSRVDLGVAGGALYRLRRPRAGGARVFALRAPHFQVPSPGIVQGTRVCALLRSALFANPASTAASAAGNCPGFLAKRLEACSTPSADVDDALVDSSFPTPTGLSRAVNPTAR